MTDIIILALIILCIITIVFALILYLKQNDNHIKKPRNEFGEIISDGATYDKYGYDEYGYDKSGYNCYGYDKDGYNENGNYCSDFNKRK